MPKDTRNTRTLAVAYRLQDIVAANVTAGVNNLQTQRAAATHGPTSGQQSDRHSKGGHSDPTADIAAEQYRLATMLEDLRELLLAALEFEFTEGHVW